MVRGIDSFREWFKGYEEQYVVIGGTACDLLMADIMLEMIDDGRGSTIIL